MKGSAALMVALVAVASLAGAAPRAMPDQVPELMSRSILPVTRDVPTCVAVADRVAGESDYLVVGLANGTINVFYPSGSDMIVRVIDLGRSLPVDDVCAVRLEGARTDFAVLAVQGCELSAFGEDVSRVKGALTLPAPAGAYELAVIEGAGGEGSPDRVLVHDEHAAYEVSVSTTDQSWGLSVAPVVVSSSALTAHPLSDRVVLVASDGSVHEFTTSSGLSGEDDPAPVRGQVLPGELSDDGTTMEVLVRDGDGDWFTRDVALPDSLTLAMTVQDSLLLLGGALTRDELRNAGWLMLVGVDGEIVARGEHGRAAAAATTVGEWIAVQGHRQNLSLYDTDLRPVWDNASQVAPLAVLGADLDADTTQDLVVVGMREFGVETERVMAIREVLGRPNFMEGAEVRGRSMYLDRPMLNVYYSHAGELESIVAERRRTAEDHRRSREYDAAARDLLTARAAAATLGHRDEAESLRREGARMLSMPRRERATLAAAALLLVAGVWVAASWSRRIQERVRVGSWPGEPVLLPALLAAGGGIAWWLVGHGVLAPTLILGAVVAGGSIVVASLKASEEPPPPRRPGAPVEELEMRILEFTHGGSGSSSQGRKKLTNIAYIMQEMVESLDDPERYAMLHERLKLRYNSFYPSKYKLAQDLPDHARKADVAVAEADALAQGARALHGALTAVLSSPHPTDGTADALREALKAREDIRVAADAADAIVRKNPGCSVIACIDRIVDEKREVLMEMGVDVDRDVGLGSEEDAVAIQHSQLELIIENLVTNALRAMDDSRESRLTFRTTAVGRNCEIRVADTGCGIAPNRLGELFVPKDRESVLGGTGLPHSRELLRRVGGNIVVEDTEPGRGTTFLVTVRFWSPAPSGKEAPHE